MSPVLALCVHSLCCGNATLLEVKRTSGEAAVWTRIVSGRRLVKLTDVCQLGIARGDRTLHQCLTRFASTISSLKLNTFGSLGSTIARTQCVSG
jgi:hypothetical protein